MNQQSTAVSIIIPLYNEEESLEELHDWIVRVVEKNQLSYEIIFVDDGSKDESWTIIKKLKSKNPFVKGIQFNRNYGKSAALDTGFKHCKGEVVIMMDADLQDSPDEIPGLVDMIKNQNYELISGWKKKRHDPLSKTIPTKLFNWATRRLSGIYLHDFNCGLKAYKKIVVKNIEIYGEMHRYIPLIAKWGGFSKIGEKVVQHQARKYGKTKFGLERFMYGFLDLLSITFVHKFKKRPMHFFGVFGVLSFFIGTLMTSWIIGEKIYRAYHHLKVRDVTDQPLFFISLAILIIGVQLFLAGFISEMIVLNRPKHNEYIIAEEV